MDGAFSAVPTSRTLEVHRRRQDGAFSAVPEKTGKGAARISSLLRQHVGSGILSLTRRSMP